MKQGVIKGYFNWGMNPCHSAPNAGNVRRSIRPSSRSVAATTTTSRALA